ncbi:hypothetical protein [Streptantibioticus silvisoli]|uniref:Class I SAM-dependent methyltransferase n=1 Tax=Streptantibioticus silvisoli TaxID=2705255 RepID=A0ABT6W196_9ACTN|nr:hypothetical protein [Streptantibioticus silvisoli]MDI5964039.1 hypothetical protein [Streptantibioticus silvisoli]
MPHQPATSPADAFPDSSHHQVNATLGAKEHQGPWGRNQVWAVALDHPESRTTPTWMLNAAEMLVEHYSPASGRVLVLAAAAVSEWSGTRGVLNADDAARRRGRQMIPLMEIAAVGARLGRHLEVRLHDGPKSGPAGFPTEPDRDSHPVPTPGTALPPEADLGPDSGLLAAGLGDVADRVTTTPSDPVAWDADRFDTVILIAHKPAPAAVPSVTWSHLLRPGGTLAVITHGYASGNRVGNLGTALRRSAAAGGLVQIDRVPLLEVPIRRDALAAERPAGFADHDGPPWPRRHADLFLFAMPGAREARETGARR